MSIAEDYERIAELIGELGLSECVMLLEQGSVASEALAMSGLKSWEHYLPGGKAADVWIRLHDTAKTLSADEIVLYESLTKLFATDASIMGYTVTDISEQTN